MRRGLLQSGDMVKMCAIDERRSVRFAGDLQPQGLEESYLRCALRQASADFGDFAGGQDGHFGLRVRGWCIDFFSFRSRLSVRDFFISE